MEYYAVITKNKCQLTILLLRNKKSTILKCVNVCSHVCVLKTLLKNKHTTTPKIKAHLGRQEKKVKNIRTELN